MPGMPRPGATRSRRNCSSAPLIGESILFYRKENNQAVAINNACPHRYSPLHLGTLMGDVVECKYHGLRYDSTGRCVHNPHGDGKNPGKDVYQVLSRWRKSTTCYGSGWATPALADPATIPDFSCQSDPDYPSVEGVIEMHGNYELITDNLMDLSHVEFLHKGILGSEAIKRGEHELLQDGTTVWSNRWCPDGLGAAGLGPHVQGLRQAGGPLVIYALGCPRPHAAGRGHHPHGQAAQ